MPNYRIKKIVNNKNIKKMKNLYLLSVTGLIFTLLFSACRPSPEEAKKYNEEIIEIQSELVYKVENLNKAFETFDNQKIATALKITNQEIEKALKSSSKIKDFDKKTLLKDALDKFIVSVKAIADENYKEMARIYALPEEDWDKNLDETFNDYKNDAKISFDTAVENFSSVQEEFALKYNIKLVNIK